MKTSKLKLFVGIFATILLLPATGQAYFTTDQTSTRLSGNTVMFTVTYNFGLKDRGLLMPIGAIRSDKDESPFLEYSLLTENDEVTDAGSSTGIVLTKDKDVEFHDNQYYLPPNENAVFTLVTLLTIADDQLVEDVDLSLLVTNLPFTIVIDEKLHKNQLNPSELKYYRTPEIEFEASN